MPDTDQQLRLAAFAWLAAPRDLYGDVLRRQLLADGFEFQGERVPLLGPQGIFKPRLCELPLSITTAPNGPYDDRFSPDGLLAYRYRGADPQHPANVGLRAAMVRKIPLIYFNGLVPGRYLATWPVFIVGDRPEALMFTVAVDDEARAYDPAQASTGEGPDARRAYITYTARRRLHQRTFRERVLKAYQEQCALCRLRHNALLDAAHIIPDAHPDGEPSVQNDVALCKLHHAAFDAMMVGIRPDYLVELRRDLLEEIDGPMLQHGLKEMHGQRLVLPHDRALWPDQSALEQRFDQFRHAS
ncbi:MAG TPA: HNH endonuclease [Gemmatimonadaceae bacterium]|nr:HNH endonuclease [Gemmatimonadaceae bacterium]